MPPVSGLRQPTLVRLAFEKLEPANGPAEKMRGFCGDSGSTEAAPDSSRVRAIRLRPARTISSPCSSRVVMVRSSSRMSRYLRIVRSFSNAGDDPSRVALVYPNPVVVGLGGIAVARIAQA
jgi:hypothetical protein